MKEPFSCHFLYLGWFGDEDARGRVDPREEDGQDLQADGQEHGRKALPR